MEDSPKTPMKSRAGHTSIDVYAVQCGKCFKWRVIPTQEEYEDIRSRFVEDPFFCDTKPDVSCEDPADIEYDATRTWVADKPNLPKTPVGFQRGLVLRRDYSKLDAHYVTPTGKKARASSGIASFLEENPEYKDLSMSDFSFTVPKVMDDTIPENVARKGSASGSKRIKSLRDNDY
uniref:Putative methyl-CpG-binding domain-containing protein 1-like n=1 Tax=Davidia involucrata TaxID=16924 RepID=A0A5B7BUB7_DAVIN